MVVVSVAIGSNLGEKLKNISHAIGCLGDRVGRVGRTSSMYTTTPQYVENQPVFFNAVVQLETDLTPSQLLEEFKKIEQEVGRVPSIRYGPRAIDLDIIFYDSVVVNTTTAEGPLIIPHEKILERDFVLKPLADVCPDYVHPILKKPVSELLSNLLASPEYISLNCDPPVRVVPINDSLSWPLGQKTYVMGILNITPDSFSDGGKNNNVENALKSALEMISSGCSIIDIGGESSQPNAVEVTIENELSRVIPVIKMIREHSSIPISIDTTKAIVAKAAIEAGANIINDISGGIFDSKMLETAAKLNVPIILMHMKGTPQTMTKMKKYDDVVEEVSVFLQERIKAAQMAGISTWNIIVDPGIGFAKDKDLNLQILREMKKMTTRMKGVPILIGCSRKKFIGTICSKPIPSDRCWGTAATSSAAICGGADILRVHDVAETVDVAKVSDAIWRV